MHIFDRQIVSLLGEAVKASGDGQKRAASELVRLLRSGSADTAALDDLAADLAKTWGPDIRRYYWDLCRKLGLCK